MDVYLVANILFGSLAAAGFCFGILTPRSIPRPLDCVVLAFVSTVVGLLLAFSVPGLVILAAAVAFWMMAFGKSVGAIAYWLRHRNISS